MKALALRRSAVCLLFPLSACMNMSGLGGDSKYACKAPEGVACDSVSGTYANAIRHNLPSQRTRQPATTPDSEESLPTAAPRAAPSDPVNGASGAVTPSPLRSQARILRLWIKPWEDVDGDLYDQGYVYVQVDNGQWLIDRVQRQIRDTYAPLKPPPKAAVDSPEPNPAANPPIMPLLPQRPPFAGSGTPRAQ